MLTYILIGLGAAFAITGLVIFIKGIGTKTNSKLKFLGIEIETRSTSLIIFVVGVALIAFGATINKGESKPAEPIDPIVHVDPQDPGTDTGTVVNHTTPTDKPDDKPKPFKEFSLTAGEKHVENDLRSTFKLMPGFFNTAENTVKIRVWREITNPLSDTAQLDPSEGQPGVEIMLFKIDQLTSLSITDIGQFKAIVHNPVVSGKRIQSVEMKLYRPQ